MPRRREPDPFALRVGTRIRELRLARGMSVATLADAAFISKGHISSLEHGLVAFTVTTLARIAAGLRVSAADLVNFPEDDLRSALFERTRTMREPELRELLRSFEGMKDASAEARRWR